MVYYNLLTVVKRMIANQTIPAFPGLWAVHIVFLLVAAAMLLHVTGRLHEIIYNFRTRGKLS